MSNDIKLQLSALPPLERREFAAICKICETPSHLFDVVDFNKYCSSTPFDFGYSAIPVEYYRCPNCDFTFSTTFDEWTGSDFSRFVYNDDYIKVDPDYAGVRSHNNAVFFSGMLGNCKSKRILDYGSGDGSLRKEMMERGFEVFENFDPFSSPEKPAGKFDIILLMEVIEHTPWPMQTLSSILEFLKEDGIVLIGQTLQPDNINEIRGNWWYLAPRNGHVSTYSERTFIKMSEDVGLKYHRGGALYCFQRGNPDPDIANVTHNFQPIKIVRLLADDHLEEGVFHGPEVNAAASYQWSGGTLYRWVVPADAEHVSAVEIPFCMTITESYAEQCRVLINGNPVKAIATQGKVGGALRFDLAPSSTPENVTVVMPEPLTPRARHGAADDRPLGLALLTRRHFGLD